MLIGLPLSAGQEPSSQLLRARDAERIRQEKDEDRSAHDHELWSQLAVLARARLAATRIGGPTRIHDRIFHFLSSWSQVDSQSFFPFSAPEGAKERKVVFISSFMRLEAPIKEEEMKRFLRNAAPAGALLFLSFLSSAGLVGH